MHAFKKNAYQKSQFQAESPLKKILLVYGYAINACLLEDKDKFSKAVHLLKQSLDFRKAPEVAVILLRTYNHWTQKAEENDFKSILPEINLIEKTWMRLARESARAS